MFERVGLWLDGKYTGIYLIQAKSCSYTSTRFIELDSCNFCGNQTHQLWCSYRISCNAKSESFSAPRHYASGKGSECEERVEPRHVGFTQYCLHLGANILSPRVHESRLLSLSLGSANMAESQSPE